MATTTPNLILTKPAGSDAALISVINTNMDILDNAVTLAGGQTLTNKVLTSPHMTSPVVDSGGLAMTSGDLTVTSGKIVFGPAVAQLLAGSTSFSIRNSINSADNLIVTDAGVATVRAGLIVTAGDFTLNGVLLGTTFGAWTAFTPTVQQSGAVAVTVTSARHLVLGKVVLVQVELTVTGSGSSGSTVDVTLVSAIAARLAGGVPRGHAGTESVFDASTNVIHSGIASFATSTIVRIYKDGEVNGIGAGAGSTIGLAAGDIITLALGYELP